jgi:general secretion pathway protein L
MKVVGIDVGTFSVKIAELEVLPKGYIVNQIYERTLSPDVTKDKSLEIIEILRSISASYDLNSTRFVFAIPQHMVSVHHKRFPFRERLKVQKSLAFELEDEIPFDIDDTLFDAKIVEYIGETADVLTVACPKEAVIETLAHAKDGGFDPEIVSVEGLALANCFEAWATPPPELSASARASEDVTSVGVTTSSQGRIILHMGHSRTLMLAYRDSGLVAVRSLMWGGMDVANSIAHSFSIPVFEAVKILQSKSFILMNSAGASRDQLAMSKAVSESIDELVRELRLTLLEVRSAFNLELTQISILGGVSQIQNLGSYLTLALEIPANPAHHLNQHKFLSSDIAPFEISASKEATSAVAIGLALEGLKRPRNPAINLRKGEFARENVSLQRFWNKWRVAAQVATFSFILLMVYTKSREAISLSLIESVDTHLTETAGQVAGLKGSAASQSGVERYIHTQQTLIKNREALMQLDSYNSSMDILARLAEKLPVTNPPIPGKGLNVHHLIINNDNLSIEGRADGPGLITGIEAALKDFASTKAVTKAAPGPLPEGPGTPFAYKLKVNRR